MRILALTLLMAFIAHAFNAQQTELSNPSIASATQVQNSWEGTYTFNEGGGRTAGGTGMFVEHSTVIYRHNGTLIADIDANGYQTSRSLRCSTKTEGNKISLYLQRYREDNTFERYKKGQLLLTLERSTVGRRTRILTYWGAYQSAFRTLRNGRVYFRKTK